MYLIDFYYMYKIDETWVNYFRNECIQTFIDYIFSGIQCIQTFIDLIFSGIQDISWRRFSTGRRDIFLPVDKKYGGSRNLQV